MSTSTATEHARSKHAISRQSGRSSMPKFVIWAVLAAFGFVAAITALNIYTPKTIVVCNAISC